MDKTKILFKELHLCDYKKFFKKIWSHAFDLTTVSI